MCQYKLFIMILEFQWYKDTQGRSLFHCNGFAAVWKSQKRSSLDCNLFISFPDGLQSPIWGQIWIPREKYNELDTSLVIFGAV